MHCRPRRAGSLPSYAAISRERHDQPCVSCLAVTGRVPPLQPWLAKSTPYLPSQAVQCRVTMSRATLNAPSLTAPASLRPDSRCCAIRASRRLPSPVQHTLHRACRALPETRDDSTRTASPVRAHHLQSKPALAIPAALVRALPIQPCASPRRAHPCLPRRDMFRQDALRSLRLSDSASPRLLRCDGLGHSRPSRSSPASHVRASHFRSKPSRIRTGSTQPALPSTTRHCGALRSMPSRSDPRLASHAYACPFMPSRS